MARYQVICGRTKEFKEGKKFIPSLEFNGNLHGLVFSKGVAETDNKKEAEYVAKDFGYDLVDTQKEDDKKVK